MSKPMFSWRHAVLKSALPPTTRHVLLTLCCHMNEMGEGCFPSVTQLIAETGLSNRAVLTHLNKARDAGFIESGRHGFSGQKWARNEYRIKWPGTPEGGEPGSLSDVEGGERGALSDGKGGERGSLPSPKGGERGAPPSGRLDSSSTSLTPLISPQIENSDGSAAPSDIAGDPDEPIRKTAEWMLARLRRLNPQHREPNWRRWHREIRLMVEKDKRTLHAICELFAWANADPFWQSNILSPGKLRRQWDALVIRRKSVGGAVVGEAAVYRCINNDGRQVKRMVPGTGWLCAECLEIHERSLAHA